MSDPSHRLEVQHLTRVFGGRPVVDDLSLTVAAGQVTCLLGPSGCGKSTTLRMIAGVEQPDQGRVLIDGAVVSDEIRFLPPEARSVGLMFQDFALFPHLSVEGNIAFGLRGSRDDKAARVAELLEKVNLPGFAKKHPHQLSGGEQQRVAIARAVAKQPTVMLCDEPTGALDSATGVKVLEALVDVNHSIGATTLLITHNASVAEIADRVVVFADGKVRETRVNPAPISPRNVTW